MPRVLLLVNKYKDSYLDFIKSAEKLEVNLTISSFKDIEIYFKNNEAHILVKGIELKEFDIIYFRSLIRSSEIAAIIKSYCIFHKKKVFDEIHMQDNYIEGKAFDYMKLSLNRLPIIDSLFISKHSLSSYKDKIKFPCIAKLTKSSQGNNVHKVNNFDELVTVFNIYPKNRLLVQEYIENDGDLRVIVLGNNVLGAIKRQSQNKDEFRNNIAVGGKGDIYILDNHQKKLALDSSSALGYFFAGIDLIYSKEKNEWLIMEVNISPQFAEFKKVTNIDIESEIIKYIKDN